MTFATVAGPDAWTWSVEYLNGRVATEADLETFAAVEPGVVAVILAHTRGGPTYRVAIPVGQPPVFIRRRSITLPGPITSTRTIVGWGTEGVGQFMVLADHGQIRHCTRLDQA